MLISMLLGLISGLSIFFVAILIMSKTISRAADYQFKKWVSIFTTNPIMGIFVGGVVTAITHSSSGTTVMVVSLVNSGVMNLYQATAVIMGANIGSTFTAQLISFNFYNVIPHLLFIGVLFYYLNFHPAMKQLGKFMIGFCLLFVGIQIMSQSMDPLKHMSSFQNLMISIEDQSFKGILVGLITTAIIQSSSTGVAILQSLSFQGLINLAQALPILLGQNIGTCITTIMASFAVDKNGKRAAIIHLLFNISGVVLLYPFLDSFSQFVSQLTPLNPMRQIANAHTIFNVLNTLILIPFISQLVWISQKIIR
ncbi:phosphate:Na+ symporter [Anaerosolibacter carboniphilus]|uniref:Phosphate:Na+ symporter n=1 Tax=Anaerosolibacter carboniphilus TaxID=1417629 RepID=A0A841L3W8_9FIRM|nr:Na/Pi cotransporter family protein [Anaerosolibacter carboniphilus]MBB6217079.1 phosphate:Na+ symporter [Anaerosolibacter carboniphilus]